MICVFYVYCSWSYIALWDSTGPDGETPASHSKHTEGTISFKPAAGEPLHVWPGSSRHARRPSSLEYLLLEDPPRPLPTHHPGPPGVSQQATGSPRCKEAKLGWGWVGQTLGGGTSMCCGASGISVLYQGFLVAVWPSFLPSLKIPSRKRRGRFIKLENQGKLL